MGLTDMLPAVVFTVAIDSLDDALLSLALDRHERRGLQSGQLYQALVEEAARRAWT
jgi:hypothetical protein